MTINKPKIFKINCKRNAIYFLQYKCDNDNLIYYGCPIENMVLFHYNTHFKVFVHIDAWIKLIGNENSTQTIIDTVKNFIVGTLGWQPDLIFLTQTNLPFSHGN